MSQTDVVERPETKYVAVGDSEVAYQVAGNGPHDVLWIYPLGSHVDLFWEMRAGADTVDRLCSFSRVIILDRRGTGASGPAPDGLLLAGKYSPKTSAQCWMLRNHPRPPLSPIAKRARSQPSMPECTPNESPHWSFSIRLLDTEKPMIMPRDNPRQLSMPYSNLCVPTWGTEEFARLGVPSAAGDSETLRMMAMMERASATPKQAAALYEYFLRYGDIRHVLPTIQIPTLIFHVQNSPLLPIAHGRYLVEHIEGAEAHRAARLRHWRRYPCRCNR